MASSIRLVALGAVRRVYEGDFVEDWPYESESFTFVESEIGVEHVARWMSVEELWEDETTFYTPELLEAL